MLCAQGTIAEAAIRGLPTWLSSFLPGQEAGNVPFVVDNGFGAYGEDASTIAEGVSQWVRDPKALETMAANARACGTVHQQATRQIAEDLLSLLDGVER